MEPKGTEIGRKGINERLGQDWLSALLVMLRLVLGCRLMVVNFETQGH